jgi:hypothetical protein
VFRNVLAEMVGDEARIGIIAAAGRIADLKIDHLAPVELFGRLRRGWAGETKGRRKTERDQARAPKTLHRLLPPARRPAPIRHRLDLL